MAGLDERNEKIVGEIAAAEDARKQAKEALAQYEQNLADARAESQKMLEDTKAQQASLAANLKATADAELSAMREKAVADIDAAKKQALNELYTESVNLATVMAEQDPRSRGHRRRSAAPDGRVARRDEVGQLLIEHNSSAAL